MTLTLNLILTLPTTFDCLAGRSRLAGRPLTRFGRFSNSSQGELGQMSYEFA
jgi:hypothetical protein